MSENFLRSQTEVIDKIDRLIDEAKNIKHSVLHPKKQAPPDTAESIETYKKAVADYTQLYAMFYAALDKNALLEMRVNALQEEADEAVAAALKAQDEIEKRGGEEWRQYMQMYFARNPQKRARYEAYLRRGCTPLQF